MAQPFNPYAEWLGVRSAAARPNHYELLRLRPFEPDPDAILTAANMQMAKVRGVRPGEHSEDWRRLLDELGAAKNCLTDLVEKTQYDAGLRENGWPDRGANSSIPAGQNPNGGAESTSQSDHRTDEKKSPYMEVTDRSVSNPLPPQFGPGKNAGSSSTGVGVSANPSVGGQPTNSTAWQPGTNLMPPGRREGSDVSAAHKPAGGSPPNAAQSSTGGPAQAWIPAAASDKAWTPPSPSAAKSAQAPPTTDSPFVSPSSAPPTTNDPASSKAPFGAAPKPKLQFPGETVPIAPVPSPPTTLSPLAPIAPVPAAGFPPAPAYPTGMPQPAGAFNQFPRPFPPSPLPAAAPPGAASPSGGPQPPSMPMPQQPFGAPFFPGGPMRPGMNPQFPQVAPGAFGAPNYFPQPPAAPNPYAPMPMPPPGGMPGYYPQPAMPGFAGGYPQQAVPLQPMPPQATAPQPMQPQSMAAGAGSSFLDDVLSGPKHGGQSALDELGFGDAPAPQQPPGAWQPDNFSQSGAVVADPGGFGQTPPQFSQLPPPIRPEFDPSAEEPTHRPRATAPAPQNSRTLLIGGALAAVVLLACLLIAAVILKQKDSAVANNDVVENGPVDSSSAPTHTVPPKNSALPTGSIHDSSSKTHDPVANPTAEPTYTSPTVSPANNPPKTTPPEQPGPKSNQPTRPTTLVVQPTTPDPTKPKSAKPPSVDPAKVAKLNHLLADVRRKLAERNQEEANRLIADATPLAVTAEQADRVQRMSTLVRYVGEFWGAVHDALGGLKATDEIDIGSDKAVVVEKDDQSLTIRMAGGNHRISLREMPSGFAVALANRWLDPSKPQNKVFVGAFFAVDPKHGPDDARQLWSEAAAAGVTDGTYLLPLLNPEPAEADMAGGDMDALAAVPDVKALERVSLKVKEEFDDALSAATTPTKQAELVQKLFDAADSSDEPVKKYVLLVDARDIAARAGRAKLTIEAIDRLAKDFRIDALDMKADTFSNYPPTTPAGGREVMHAAMALVEEALSAKRIPLASRLAQVAVAAAQVSGANGLIKQAMQRSKELEALASK